MRVSYTVAHVSVRTIPDGAARCQDAESETRTEDVGHGQRYITYF